MSGDANKQLIFGLEEQWRIFQTRHAKFLEGFDNLMTAIDTAFLRDLMTPQGNDVFYFALGRVCVEDFWELLLLAGNGYGIGAHKMLRALYERAVTLLYLGTHPEHIDNFLDYDIITKHKIGRKITETGYLVPGLTDEVLEKNRKEFERVKNKFMVTDCEKCETTRLNHSWNKLDFVSMANTTPLKKLLVPAYYIPMYHTHSTATAIYARLQPNGSGFNPDLQPDEATRGLRYAHEIILYVLRAQNDHFKMQALGQALGIATREFCEIWPDTNADDLCKG
jgi:hypothetical protein